MTKTYACPIHRTTHVRFCEQCMDNFRTRRPAAEMSVEERAVALENISPILTIPLSDLQQWIEELVGRGVWTHELGEGGLERLAAEVRSGRAASMREVLDTIPPDTQVVIIASDGSPEMTPRKEDR